ncbi:MAG TPA: hypothetical protein VFR10_09225 [bacterium]|nr:hypothetical protein [bacterium]
MLSAILYMALGSGLPGIAWADSRVRVARESESSETAWSIQLREEDFELYWNGRMDSGESSLRSPLAGISLHFPGGTMAAGGLRGVTPEMVGRHLSVFSFDVQGSGPEVGAGANVEGVVFEFGGDKGGGFVSVARELEGAVRKSALVHIPMNGGRARISAGAFVEDDVQEMFGSGRVSRLDWMVSTGRSATGPETSVSLREKDRRAAMRVSWRDGPEGREWILAGGAGISKGRFSATRFEISGSPFGLAIRDSRARGILRSAWGPWRVFAGADTRRLAAGTSKTHANVGFTKIVAAGIFATTDLAWDTVQATPGVASFTLAGRLASLQGSLQSEISARTGRRLSLSLERGQSMRTRAAMRWADRVNSNARLTFELTLIRVD